MRKHFQKKDTEYEKITFTNQNYNFNSFYDKMTNTMLELCETKGLEKCLMLVECFILEYLYSVVEIEKASEIKNNIIELHERIDNDKDLQEILKKTSYNIDVRKEYVKKYYDYYIDIMKLWSLFLSSLTSTFMPSVTKGTQAFNYTNYQNFFSGYSKIKSRIGDTFSDFKIKKYMLPINNIIIFYYSYRIYVTDLYKGKISRSLNLVLDFIKEDDMLDVLYKGYLGTEDMQKMMRYKKDIFNICLRIYSVLNSEHSKYGLNPKPQKPEFIDKTLI